MEGQIQGNPGETHTTKLSTFLSAKYLFHCVPLKLTPDIKSIERDIGYLFCSAQESKSTNHDWMAENCEAVNAYSVADASISLSSGEFIVSSFLLQLAGIQRNVVPLRYAAIAPIFPAQSSPLTHINQNQGGHQCG